MLRFRITLAHNLQFLSSSTAKKVVYAYNGFQGVKRNESGAIFPSNEGFCPKLSSQKNQPKEFQMEEKINTLTDAEKSEKCHELIEDIKTCMLTTHCTTKHFDSRPMQAIVEDDSNDIWFFTSKNTITVKQIANNSNVHLAFGCPEKNSYLSVSGVAELNDDMMTIKRLWNPMMKAWFPEGYTDPSIILIKVHPKYAEYWDTASSSLVQLYGLVKSAFTGETPYAKRDDKTHSEVKLQ